MTYMNLDVECNEPAGPRGTGRPSKGPKSYGVMPAHVFLRLFLSAFAAILTVRRGRKRRGRFPDRPVVAETFSPKCHSLAPAAARKTTAEGES
jgi:hypothetical protein